MIVAVVGSRKAQVSPERIFQALPEGCNCIVTGGAKGVDTAAAQCARQHGLHLIEILPDYARYGRTAPIIRNKRIVRRADYLLAFWDYRAPGTRSAILECLKQRKRFQIIVVEDNASLT